MLLFFVANSECCFFSCHFPNVALFRVNLWVLLLFASNWLLLLFVSTDDMHYVHGHEILNCTLIYSTVICHKRTLRQNHCCYYSLFINTLPRAYVSILKYSWKPIFLYVYHIQLFAHFPSALHSIHFCHSIFTNICEHLIVMIQMLIEAKKNFSNFFNSSKHTQKRKSFGKRL